MIYYTYIRKTYKIIKLFILNKMLKKLKVKLCDKLLLQQKSIKLREKLL